MRLLLIQLAACMGMGLHAQDKGQLPADRYRMVFGHGEEGMYLYSMPDSSSRNLQWPGRDTALWAYDMYLFANYAETFHHEEEMEKILPDSTAVRARFKEMLGQDTAYARMFRQSMPDRRVPDILIDSLLRIASHFYYLHRSRERVTAHICVGINKVKALPQSNGSPYYAAFCYQVIRSQEDPFAIFYRAKDAAGDSLWNAMPDELLHKAEQDIYRHAAADPDLRKQLMDAYYIKKRYLNFSVVE